MDRVRFFGWKDEPWESVKEATAVIVASDYEGFCLTAHEASAIGMTVITTPVNGCTDYIIPGKNGYYFEFGNSQNLSDLLDYIGKGILPLCKEEDCRNSVEPFLCNNYFDRVIGYLNKI